MKINIRKVKENDLLLLLKWRNQKKVRNLFVNRHIISNKEHIGWWKQINESSNKFLWIVENNSKSIGVIQIFKYSLKKKSFWWSGHLGENVKKYNLNTFGIWCAIEEQVIKIAKKFKCKKILCETFSKNKIVLQIHERYDYKVLSTKKLKYKNQIETLVVTQKNLI